MSETQVTESSAHLKTVGHVVLWRTVGVLLVAHVVLMLVGFALQTVAPMDYPSAQVSATLQAHSLDATLAGTFVALLSFLVFLFAGTLLPRLVGTHTSEQRWLASAASSLAVVYVAVTAFAGATGATDLAHRGASVDAVIRA